MVKNLAKLRQCLQIRISAWKAKKSQCIMEWKLFSGIARFFLKTAYLWLSKKKRMADRHDANFRLCNTITDLFRYFYGMRVRLRERDIAPSRVWWRKRQSIKMEIFSDPNHYLFCLKVSFYWFFDSRNRFKLENCWYLLRKYAESA